MIGIEMVLKENSVLLFLVECGGLPVRAENLKIIQFANKAKHYF